MPQVTITSNTVGAEIRYSTDNSDVTEQSTLYSGQFSVEAGTTVKAKAFKSGMNPSPQSTLQSLPKLQTPTISLSRSGSTINITIGNTVSGATYRYKVGSAPTSASDGTAITGTGSVNNSAAVTIYVAGWYTGQYNPSDSASDSVAQYTPTLQTPTLSLSRNGSTVNGTIGNTVSGATYVYKIGSAPSSQSDGTTISGTTFSFSNSNAVTVYVRGYKSGYNPSSTASDSVSSYVNRLPTPSFTIQNVSTDGSWEVKLSNLASYDSYTTSLIMNFTISVNNSQVDNGYVSTESGNIEGDGTISLMSDELASYSWPSGNNTVKITLYAEDYNGNYENSYSSSQSTTVTAKARVTVTECTVDSSSTWDYFQIIFGSETHGLDRSRIGAWINYNASSTPATPTSSNHMYDMTDWAIGYTDRIQSEGFKPSDGNYYFSVVFYDKNNEYAPSVVWTDHARIS